MRLSQGIKARSTAIGSALIALSVAVGIGLAPVAFAGSGGAPATTTPIKHVVVIFQENVSFDHYFATYPYATNTDGTYFKPAPDTPSVNGLGTLSGGEPAGILLTANPNVRNRLNGSNGVNPFRLSYAQASTCDQDHNYGAEQLAFDAGLMDFFPGSTGEACPAFDWSKGSGIVMGYFDGNTVTALWNYAQHFAMNDNAFGTTFGPSSPGAVNLVAGTTYPATPKRNTPKVVAVANGSGTLVGDMDPAGDVCSRGITVRMGGKNIGDLLNEKGITWGSFMGGFNLNAVNPDGSTGCARQSPASLANGGPAADYIPHHAWFQYWASTANPTHIRPSVPPSQYGSSSDTANHEYDIDDFFAALHAGNLPAVSFLKAPAAMDGHAGYSDPLLEQQFLVGTINQLEKSPFWGSTAIFINWDDSDGWYDHQMSPIVNPSAVIASANQPQFGDNLNGTGHCGNGAPMTDGNGHPIQGRCGYGPRLPLLVISPWAKENFVDHALVDQSSILRFIEDNWNTGRIGNGSFDAIAGDVGGMFDFSAPPHSGDHHWSASSWNGARFGNGPTQDQMSATNGLSHTLFLDPATGAPGE
jgi:phospholipase C